MCRIDEGFIGSIMITIMIYLVSNYIKLKKCIFVTLE